MWCVDINLVVLSTNGSGSTSCKQAVFTSSLAHPPTGSPTTRTPRMAARRHAVSTHPRVLRHHSFVCKMHHHHTASMCCRHGSSSGGGGGKSPNTGQRQCQHQHQQQRRRCPNRPAARVFWPPFGGSIIHRIVVASFVRPTSSQRPTGRFI